jgi:hypothetical protein
MALPGELLQQIREAEASQGIDAAAAIHSITTLVGDSECVDYSVWTGRVWRPEIPRLDVYVVGVSCLYNYAVFTTRSTSAVVFLDRIQSVALLHTQDPIRPYVLAYHTDDVERQGRIFGGPDDRSRLERVQQNLVNACWRAKRSRGGK